MPWNDPGEKYRVAQEDSKREKKKDSPSRGATVKSWNEAWSQNPMQLAHFLRARNELLPSLSIITHYLEILRSISHYTTVRDERRNTL